ncbi:hypothetical protein Taro_014862 [Colocasia esculenta]|uniref:Uncharacterized protein n=1 Tax=Colocasia esculenta TaxID=4460 RepID=A0A843UJV7_COLES|nr:hypothetical protein [Colocasia esculenta]
MRRLPGGHNLFKTEVPRKPPSRRSLLVAPMFDTIPRATGSWLLSHFPRVLCPPPPPKHVMIWVAEVRAASLVGRTGARNLSADLVPCLPHGVARAPKKINCLTGCGQILFSRRGKEVLIIQLKNVFSSPCRIEVELQTPASLGFAARSIADMRAVLESGALLYWERRRRPGKSKVDQEPRQLGEVEKGTLLQL